VITTLWEKQIRFFVFFTYFSILSIIQNVKITSDILAVSFIVFPEIAGMLFCIHVTKVFKTLHEF